MKNVHNTTSNETCDKCGETEDTNHLFLECEMYSENTTTADNQNAKKTIHQGNSNKKQSKY